MTILQVIAAIVVLYIAARLFVIAVDTIVYIILLFIVWPVLALFNWKGLSCAD